MSKKIFLVSHSKKITDGLKEMIEEMQQNPTVSIESLGGDSENQLGTDPLKILAALNAASNIEQIFIFCDIGSSLMSTELALDMADDELKEKVILMNAPLIEGAFATAITAGFSDDLDLIQQEAKSAAEKNWN